MLHKKGYPPNLYSCIRLLGSQHNNYKQKVHHSLDRTRLSHKMENRQGWRLEITKKVPSLQSVIKIKNKGKEK